MGYNWVPEMEYAVPVMNVVSKLTFKFVFTSYLQQELQMRHLGVRKRSIHSDDDTKDLESAVRDLAAFHESECCEVATQTEPYDELMLSIPMESKTKNDLTLS